LIAAHARLMPRAHAPITLLIFPCCFIGQPGTFSLGLKAFLQKKYGTFGIMIQVSTIHNTI
jgi:hypothetical protein